MNRLTANTIHDFISNGNGSNFGLEVLGLPQAILNTYITGIFNKEINRNNGIILIPHISLIDKQKKSNDFCLSFYQYTSMTISMI